MVDHRTIKDRETLQKRKGKGAEKSNDGGGGGTFSVPGEEAHQQQG